MIYKSIFFLYYLLTLFSKLSIVFCFCSFNNSISWHLSSLKPLFLREIIYKIILLKKKTMTYNNNIYIKIMYINI